MASASWDARFQGGFPDVAATPQQVTPMAGWRRGVYIGAAPPAATAVTNPLALHVELSVGKTVATREPRYGMPWSHATATSSLFG
jgi:hypothetical protein